MTKQANHNVTVKIRFAPHSGQKKILENRKRFNTLNLGRRFGKTYLGQFLLMEVAGQGFPVAWFSPTYKDLTQVWKRVKRKLEPLIASKNEQIKQIELVNGAVIDFWSLDDPDNGRGRKYKRVIIDEVAKVKSAKFAEAWEQNIRATLADYSGDCYFLSTPKGYGNYWHKLCQRNDEEWTNFNMPTDTNPHIPKSEIEAAKRDLPPAIYRQEYEASFENLQSELWFYEWDERFILEGKEQIEIDNRWPLYLSIDFNVDPCSAILFQVFNDADGGIYIIDEFQISGGTRALCQRLKLYKDHPMMLFATGDSTGHKRDSAAIKTNWQIVCDELDLRESNLVDTRRVNPLHEVSRELTAVAMNLELIWINERCEQLVNGIRKAVPNKTGKLFKDDSDPGSHLVDCLRYAIHSQALPDGRETLIRLANMINAAA